MKKIRNIFVLVLVFILSSTTVFAYNFPTPDWGALLRERENMVKEKEFSLYVEADPATAPYYGSRLEPGSGTYIGMIAENSKLFKPLGSYLTYIDNGGGLTDLYYPANDMITNDNVVAMIGWNFGSMYDVNYNNARVVLDNLNKYNKPMYIRFAAEMNCSSLGDEPDVYVNAFRTIADMVHEYPNFAMVWSPNDIGALDRPFEYYYPGDEYVDWVGISCYSIKYFLGNQNTEYKDSVYFMTGDYAWATNRIKPVIDFMQRNNINKPIMLSEGGVATNNSYGEDCSAWAAPRLRNMLWYVSMKYPQVKMINYFNTYRPNEIEKFDLDKYPFAVETFQNALNQNGMLVREAGVLPQYVFQPAYYAGQLDATDNVVRLYTLAYTPDYPELSVNYRIDGTWVHSSNQIPYTYYMDMNSISDGFHTLTIDGAGMSQEYKFMKSGNSIIFDANLSPSSPIPAPTVPVNDDIKVTLNGNQINFDQPPVIQDGRTLVPLRAIFEAMGASVEWNDSTKTVKAVRGADTVELTIGSNIMKKNSQDIALDVTAQIVNGRTLVPARAVAEAFGANVDWDSNTKTVIINN